jgi:hypothetical protein
MMMMFMMMVMMMVRIVVGVNKLLPKVVMIYYLKRWIAAFTT